MEFSGKSRVVNIICGTAVPNLDGGSIVDFVPQVFLVGENGVDPKDCAA